MAVPLVELEILIIAPEKIISLENDKEDQLFCFCKDQSRKDKINFMIAGHLCEQNISPFKF